MPDLDTVLLGARDVGIRQLPEAGDAGEQIVRQRLDRELSAGPAPRLGWLRRKVAVGGFGVPVVVLGVVATAAAATGTIVATSATSLFQANPQAQLKDRANAAHFKSSSIPAGAQQVITTQTVVPSSVTDVADASIADYGQVHFWSAVTKQEGFCFAVKLPDGDWASDPSTASNQPADGSYGGVVPGCTQAREQQIVDGAPLRPSAVQYEDNEIKTSTGEVWEVIYGFVTADGQAATVTDPVSDATAKVTSTGYFLLVEHPTSGDDSVNLEVISATGQQLQPDYTSGGLLPGYSFGPTPGLG